MIDLKNKLQSGQKIEYFKEPELYTFDSDFTEPLKDTSLNLEDPMTPEELSALTTMDDAVNYDDEDREEKPSVLLKLEYLGVPKENVLEDLQALQYTKDLEDLDLSTKGREYLQRKYNLSRNEVKTLISEFGYIAPMQYEQEEYIDFDDEY